jgi:hypothetical protein
MFLDPYNPMFDPFLRLATILFPVDPSPFHNTESLLGKIVANQKCDTDGFNSRISDDFPNFLKMYFGSLSMSIFAASRAVNNYAVLQWFINC